MVFSFAIPFVPSRSSGAHSYDPVPAPDEETLLASPERREIRIPTSNTTLFLDPSFWLTVFATLSIAFTIRNLFVIQLYYYEPPGNYLDASIGRPYNGLERLVRNASSPSWPLSSTHYPDFIGATEGPDIHHALNNGSVVRLDSEVSMLHRTKAPDSEPTSPLTPPKKRTIIIQHRVRDYGLEHCAVNVAFSHKAGNGHGHATPRVYGHIGESPYLTLWRLEDSGSMAVLASSALPTSVPPRKEFLGNIALDGARQVQSPFFDCNAGSIQTLEIAVACASDPCIMEFRLTRSPQRQGFWVVQSEQSPTSV